MANNLKTERLISGLCHQRESGDYCDVLIDIPDITEITVHSNVLAISSVYFSDISREPSSLLPHIPSVRVGGHVSLSATVQDDMGNKSSTIPSHVSECSYIVDSGQVNAEVDTTIDLDTAQPEEDRLKMGSVLIASQDTPEIVSVIGSSMNSVGLPGILISSGSGKDELSIVHSVLEFAPDLNTASLDGSSVDEDLITIETSDVCISDGVKQPILEASAKITNNSRPCSEQSMIKGSSNRNHKASRYRYVLKVQPVDPKSLESSRLAECVRFLVDFAYCCGDLPVTDDTYPVLHELAKLLQMDEAVSICEKHAVDRLVGDPEPTPEPEPAPSEPEPDSERRPQPARADDGPLRACRRCSFACHGAERMRDHRRMHHVRSYVCGTCGVTCQKASQLLRHLIAADHGETVCSLCFHECAAGERMADHYVRHNDPRPFFCSVCFARFPSRTGLNLHMPTHSSARPFVCGVCGQAFKWRHALQSHARTHGTEKKLLCDVCGFSTRHTGQFKAHRARHAGLTQQCPHEGCQFRATTPWLLKDHVVTHSGDKQYQCEVCGRKFGHVRNMRRHALLHAQKATLSCERCSYQTTRSDKLAQHVRTKHAPAPPDGEPAPAAEEVAAADSAVQQATPSAATEGTAAQEGAEPAATPAVGRQRKKRQGRPAAAGSAAKRRRKTAAPPTEAASEHQLPPDESETAWALPPPPPPAQSTARRFVPILPKGPEAAARAVTSPRPRARVRPLLPKPETDAS